MQAADQLVNQLIDSYGVKDTIKTLAKLSGFEETPPTIQEFIDNEFYMGTIVGTSLYPIWRNALYTIFPNPFYSPYLEIVCTGSIGQGKSTFSLIGMFYDLCKLLMMKNPHRAYKLMESKKIVFALMNATLGLAGGVLWDMAETFINESPFFKKMQGKNKNKYTVFPKKIDITTGSRTSHVLGMDTVSTILSEINFQDRVSNQAYNNYTAIKTRLQSRFMSMGSYPGRMWIDSSKKESGSFIDSVLLKGRENDPTLKVFDNPIWVALSHKGIYSGDTFKVFIGDQVRDPFILASSSQIVGIPEELVIDVPVEYRSNFEADLNGSLRDLAGKATQATHRYITSSERIADCLSKKPNPVHKVEISTDFFNKEERLIEFIDFEKIKKDSRSRFIHVDLGIVKDRCGIASTRLDGQTTIRKLDYATGKDYEERELVYSTDFVLYITAQNGQEVPIYKVRQLIKDLSLRGYPIAVVSADGYQSTNLRQDLSLDGFDTQLISVDRTVDAYSEFKNAILEGRWDGVDHPILRKEVGELEMVNGKVDHPMKGSKDGADAVAGSIWSSKINMEFYGANVTVDDMIEGLRSSKKRKNAYEIISGMS